MLFQAKHTQCVQIFFAGENAHKSGGISHNNNMKKSLAFLCLTLAFATVFVVALTLPLPTQTAHAESGLYQKLNDELVKIYEEDVAHEPVITSIPEQDLKTLAEKHSFSIKKTKALVILSDLSFRVNEPTPFATLATMRDREIIRLGKHLFDLYGKTLSKEEKSALKAKALKALKK